MDIILILISLYFFPLIVISAASSFWLLMFREWRLPLGELADSAACPFRKAIQHDMGEMNRLAFRSFSDYCSVHIDSFAASSPSIFIDIGSGDGRTTLLYLRRIFGSSKRIILSDVVPNLDSWRQLAAIDANVEFSTESRAGLDIFKFLDSEFRFDRKAISLLNSLHHLSDADFNKLVHEASARGVWLFVMDVKRQSWFHPLLIPFVYWFFYVVLAWRGSGAEFHPDNYFRRIVLVIVEAWIMSFDQAVGSARRFSLDSILRCSSQNGFVNAVDQDWLMNYIIMIPRSGHED